MASAKVIEAAQTHLQEQKDPSNLEEAKTLRASHRVIHSATHPQSCNEVLPWYSSLTGFAVLNVPYIYGALFVQMSKPVTLLSLGYT